MTPLYRLLRRKHLPGALTGESARLRGGRWNSKGTALVYLAGTRSLSLLELLVHVDPSEVPVDYVFLPVTVPDSVRIESLDLSSLPTNWRKAATLAEYGDRFVQEGRTALLAVPSVIVPQEMNYLLNPAHPQATLLQSTEAEVFEVDERLL